MIAACAAAGHTYLTYGPLLCGATNVMYEGIPLHPAPDRLWQIVAKHKARLRRRS